MNIKTIFTIITCISVFSIQAQTEISTEKKKDSIKFSLTFSTTTALTYNITKLVSAKSPDTISYQLHLKPIKNTEEVTELLVRYTDLKNGNDLYELFEDLEAKVQYTRGNKSYQILDTETITANLLKKFEIDENNKDKDLDAEGDKIIKILGKYKKPLHALYISDLKPMFSVYDKSFPYGKYVIDSTKVDKPFPASTQIRKEGVIDENDQYRYEFSLEVLNDGFKEHVRKQTEAVIKEKMAVDSVNKINYTIKDEDVHMILLANQKMILDKKGIIQQTTVIEKFELGDKVLNDIYKFIELLSQE